MEQWRRDGNNGNGWHDGNGDGDGDGRHSGDSNGRWNGNTGAATMMGGTTATQRQQRQRARRGKSGDLQGGYLRYGDNLSPCQKSLSQNGARLLQGVTRVPLKMAQGFPRSQQMASIALTIIGRIGYLDIGAIFMRVVFLSVAAGAKKGSTMSNL